MKLQELSQAMDDFVKDQDWYSPDSSRPQTPRNIAVSLSLEAGEILEHFQWSDSPRRPEDLPGELADVALYLLQLARLTNIDLEHAILEKLALNRTRHWVDGPSSPEKGNEAQ